MSTYTPYAATKAEDRFPKKRLVRWQFVFLIFAVPIAMIGLAIFVFRVGWTIRENQGRQAMEVELAKLVEEGVAIDNQTLSELYFENTSDDQSNEWSDVFSILSSLGFAASATGVPIIDRSVQVDDFADDFDTSSNWQFAENCIRFTAEQKELIAKIHVLACNPQPTSFPIVFQSTETMLPEVQSVRTVALLLRTDAQVALHLDESGRACDDIVSLFEVSKHVDAVPFVVSRLVGIAVRKLALQSLQNAIRLDTLSDEQLAKIDNTIAGHCNINNRWRTLITDELSSNLPVFITPNLSMQTDKFIPARGHDAVFFIDLMRRGAAIPADDWGYLYRTSVELEAELDKSLSSTMGKVDRLLSGLLTPAFGSLATALINDAQLHRQARVAIALRMYDHQHASMPGTLADLPSEIAVLKPYGADPFSYTSESGRPVLWGFWVSKEHQHTPRDIPKTEQPTSESLNNRAIVWWFDTEVQ